MKKHVFFFFCFILLSAMVSTAQDLKPAKDKSTKKYGYQTKDKTWVITPRFDGAKRFVDGYAEVEINGRTGLIDLAGNYVFAAEYNNISKFDRFGFCELTRKEGGTKYHGIGDRSGRIIIPVECRGVSVDRSGAFLYAKYDTVFEGFKPAQLWGVYDSRGSQLFSPQFSSSPSFHNGAAIAKSARNGLYGVIGADGSVIQDFNYLAISRSSGGYKALRTDFAHILWSEDLLATQVLPQRGAVIPYDPQGDPVRAAAWHRGPSGTRLHRNNLKAVELRSKFLGLEAVCRDLPIDWGFGRFVRLEPCEVPDGTHDAMYYASRERYYTLKALLYEADGSFVREICSRGWIEATCGEGAVYNADGRELWLVLANPNTLALPFFTMGITDYRTVNHSDIFSGLGISISDFSALSYLYNYTSLCRDIIEGENIGICSYTPVVPGMTHARAERQAGRAPVFSYPFRIGEVVNCSVHKKDDKLRLELSDELVCRFKDELEDPYYTTSGGEELIFWGPNNARTIGLSLRAAPKTSGNTSDDIHHTGYSYRFVLSMYEEDGTWLRTLAEAPWIDYIQDGIIVFEPLGIALITPFAGRPKHPSAPSGSVTGANRSGTPQRNGAVTTTQGGARNSVSIAPEPSRPAPAGPAYLTPLPHTLSAVEAALRP